MATSSTYYLNGPSLGSATAVFTDPDLTLCAADGFYFDGVIVREQVSCVLLPQQLCPACADACGGFPISEASATGGYYEIAIQLSSPTGAVVIEFNPNNVPVGIEVIYNGVVYNKLSSVNYGYLAGVANLPTYIGETASDCGIVAGSPHVLDRYTYYSGSFTATPFTNTVTVLSSQMDLTTATPGPSFMVIPKVAASPTTLQINVIAACPLSTFDVTISCPAALGSFSSSSVNASALLACSDSIDQQYFVQYVNGGAGIFGLYDWVFQDVDGEFVLPDGFYHAPVSCPPPNDWFQVQNGVIVQFGTCVYGANYRVSRCGDGQELIVSSAIPVILGDIVTLTSVVDCAYSVIAYSAGTAVDSINAVIPFITCDDICNTYDITNNTLLTESVSYLDCAAAPQTTSVIPGATATICAKTNSIVTNLTPVFTVCGCP